MIISHGNLLHIERLCSHNPSLHMPLRLTRRRFIADDLVVKIFLNLFMSSFDAAVRDTLYKALPTNSHDQSACTRDYCSTW
jgi:hypothetical protein